ncbi:hypothetical protein F2Q68_00014863 [Brassica cretica]|uniref:Uncharacterized protein n=1 Tax=Brassica cretica TaxID=69181 RepID=A0A8S9HJH5_BRACR|nr:hypothetical protein F2Q68_00014863 [Brassica cretica]
MTMRSTEKSPVVLYFKAISAGSELLPSSSSCDLCRSPIPKYHHPPAYCLPVRTRAVLSVVEKTLDMIYQKSSSLSKCQIIYVVVRLRRESLRVSVLRKNHVPIKGPAYQFYLEPPTFIGNTYGILQAADTLYLISVVHILGRNKLEINPTIRPGAAPTAPDMRVRLSQIEPDFLTRD